MDVNPDNIRMSVGPLVGGEATVIVNIPVDFVANDDLSEDAIRQCVKDRVGELWAPDPQRSGQHKLNVYPPNIRMEVGRGDAHDEMLVRVQVPVLFGGGPPSDEDAVRAFVKDKLGELWGK